MNSGQTGATLELDQAVVATDQVLRDRETEPRAVGASGHERIEQRVAQVVGHAGTVVFELHARDQPVAARADVDVGQRARAQHDAPALAVAFCAIACSALRPRLSIAWMMRLRSSAQRRQARIVVALDRRRRRRIGCEQVADVLQQLVNVDRLLARRVSRAEQRIDERRRVDPLR